MTNVLVLLLALQAAPAEAPPRESRTAYLRRLFEKDRAAAGDACRAALALADGKHSDAPFEELRKDLVSRGFLEEGWALKESDPADKGLVAVLLCKSLGIRGGLMMSIFGVTRRYALRECVHLGLIGSGPADEILGGRELLDILARAERRRAGEGP
jgi:hypothetical protein